MDLVELLPQGAELLLAGAQPPRQILQLELALGELLPLLLEGLPAATRRGLQITNLPLAGSDVLVARLEPPFEATDRLLLLADRRFPDRHFTGLPHAPFLELLQLALLP